MLKHILTTGSLILLSTNVFAWVCPNNFNQIVPGDSLEQVEKMCGKPMSQKSSEKEPNVPQEWSYYVSQPTQAGAQGPAASVKMTIAFANDKAVNITAQATSLSSTSLCGPTISVGDNSETVKAACGNPGFIQKQEAPGGGPKSLEITEYKYNTAPPNTLIFENGTLKQRK